DDLALLRAEGVEIAFTPSAAAMYPDGPRTAVHPGPLGSELEGAARPTHFAGMLTVVLKLLQIVHPDRVFFGEKDYQQLVLVRQMVNDLNVDVRVVGVPIVRESDGLAMSSRNRYLDAAQRELAGTLSEVSGIEVDYLQVRDPLLGPPPSHGPARLLVAARLGATRLLDNIAVEISTTVGVDGREPAVPTGYHESPWRN